MLETIFWTLLILIICAAILAFAVMVFFIIVMNAVATDYELDFLDEPKEKQK